MGVEKKVDARMEAILRPRGHNVTRRAVFFKLIQNVFLFFAQTFFCFFDMENVTYRGGRCRLVALLGSLHDPELTLTRVLFPSV